MSNALAYFDKKLKFRAREFYNNQALFISKKYNNAIKLKVLFKVFSANDWWLLFTPSPPPFPDWKMLKVVCQIFKRKVSQH